MTILERGMLYVLLFLSQFTGIELFNPRVGGLAIEFVLKYLVLIMGVFPAIKKKDERLFVHMSARAYYIYLFMIITLLISIVRGAGLSFIIGEAYDYLFPLSIYLWIAKGDFNKKEVIYFIWITSIVAGVVSILIATGRMEVDLWHAQGEMVRTATFVDGSMSIFVILICLFYLLTPNHYSKALNLLALCGAIATLGCGLSRSRMVITALLVFMEVMMIIPKVGQRRVIRIFAVVMIIAWIIRGNNPQLLDQVTVMIRKRFMQLSEDTSSSFRSVERGLQIQEFFMSPLIGKGWGVRANYNVNGSIMYNHCMYTALLFHGGILFGGTYLLFFFSILLGNLKTFIERRVVSERYLSLLILLGIFLLGYASAGIAQGGCVLGLLLVFQIERETKYSGQSNGRLEEETAAKV